MSAGPTSTQLRRTGRLILACGIVVAMAVYWINAARSGPVLDDSNALGYSRAMDAQMTRLMGHFGVLMMGWTDSLASPLGKALGTIAVAALLAGYCYRAAWVLDEEEREQRDARE